MATEDDAANLRKRMRDLVVLTALPALWIGRAPSAILDNLTETLLFTVGADVVYARAFSGDPPVWLESLHCNSSSFPELSAADLKAALIPMLVRDFRTTPPFSTVPVGSVSLNVFTVPLGYKSTGGHILIGTTRSDFPDSAEHVLCQVAANQVAVAFREADFVHRLQGTVGLLKTITDHSAVCFFLIDEGGRCTFMNPAAEQVFGYSFEEIQGHVLHDLVHHAHTDDSFFPLSECPLTSSLRVREPVRAHEDIMFRKSGDSFPVLCSASPIAGETGVQAIIEVHDISEWKRAERELLAKAERESLLNKIGLAIRMAYDPEGIENRAADLLGQALSADRCFFAHIDLAADRMRFGADWHRAHLRSVAGEYRPSDFAVEIAPLFSAGKNLIIRDTQAEGWPGPTVAMLDSLDLRALVDIPFFRNDRLEALLCVGMERPRD